MNSMKNQEGFKHELFQKKIDTIIKNNDLKVFCDSVNKNVISEKLNVIGSLYVDGMNKMKKALIACGMKVIDINTPHYCGIYFEDEYAEECEIYSGLFISPKKEFISSDVRILNQSRESIFLNELQAFGKENNLENIQNLDESSYIILWRGDNHIVSEILKIPLIRIFQLNFKNSHLEYRRYFLELKNGERHFHSDPSMNVNIIFFVETYYREIKLLGDLFQGQTVSIHDVGTNVAQFPLLLSSLKSEDLFGFDISQIYASDIGWTGEYLVKRILKTPGYRQVKFFKFDITVENENIPVSDVVIINDVLEHLPDEQTSFSALERLWALTNKILIVHVPFETVLNTSWGHRIVFNEDKLKDWASRLYGGELISDRYYDFNNLTYLSQGFLIIKKSG